MSSIANSLLKLAPANPILLRVVTAGGRRLRHAFTRWIYLALLIGVLLITLVTTSSGKTSLSDLARAATQVFSYISYVQLGMICLLAPVFTAGAITQERDSRTYSILLATPLTNAQIVLGSLFSRLYYVIALLLSGVPVFAITLFYGGVTAQNIVLSFAIALTTGMFTGSLAIAIAVFRLGSSKTVFWFYVFNAVYLVGLWMVDARIHTDPTTGIAHTTWLTGIHPFLALQSVVNPTSYGVPSDPSVVAGLPGIFRWYRLQPAHAYVAIMFTGSLLMVVPSAIVLRRIAQRTEAGLFEYLRGLLLPNRQTRRKVRNVWSNPVAWREAATRAGASARGITRWATITIGLAGAAVILVYYHRHALTVEEVRQWLVGLVLLQFSVALLVATNTAAGAVTRERESQTLDLLLVTPVTSHYYIWGKLRGLVSFMLPFAIVPTLTIILVVLYDGFTGALWTDNAVVYPEVAIELPLFLTTLIAWACMLGLQLSLRWSRTIVAVMGSVAVLAGICSVLGVCGMAALHIPWVGIIFAAFSPFTGICTLLDGLYYADKTFGGASGDPTIARVIMAISFLSSSAVYCMLVWFMYRSMVKNFDMIIRRQHR